MIGLTLAKEIGLLFFRYETGDIVSAGHITLDGPAGQKSAGACFQHDVLKVANGKIFTKRLPRNRSLLNPVRVPQLRTGH